jgi:hypothetical protein
MRTLAEIYEKYKHHECWGDKGTVHSYIEVYEQLLAPYRPVTRKMLELGILSGASLRMWEEYFDRAEVHGVDLCEKPLDMCDLRPMIAEGTHHITLIDASDPAQVEAHFAGQLFHVIVEDCSHSVEQQLALYASWKSHLLPDSIYIIEDVSAIDQSRSIFEKIDPTRPVRIIDRRPVKGRFDDVLVVIGGSL